MDLFSNTSKGKYDLNVDYDDGLVKPFLWCVLSAFILIMICSNKSFLYSFDQNRIISHLLWIEIIMAFFSLMAIMRIYQLFLEPRTFPYILTPITGAFIYSGKSFNGGGNAEELMFPFIMWGCIYRLNTSDSDTQRQCHIGQFLLVEYLQDVPFLQSLVHLAFSAHG